MRELAVSEMQQVSGGSSRSGNITMGIAGSWVSTTAGFGVGFTIGGPPGALIGGAVGFAVGSLVSIGFAMASRRTST